MDKYTPSQEKAEESLGGVLNKWLTKDEQPTTESDQLQLFYGTVHQQLVG